MNGFLPVDPRFLSVLNADPVEAERLYRELRHRLQRFFEWKGCLSPDDLAQETLVRGFTRLASGQEIYCDDPASYFKGIARNVLLEWWKKRKEELFDPQNPPEIHSANPEESIQRRMMLEKALGCLSPEDRAFLNEYTLEDRSALAERRGESPNALRIHAFRLREIIRRELEQGGKAPAARPSQENREMPGGHTPLMDRDEQ